MNALAALILFALLAVGKLYSQDSGSVVIRDTRQRFGVCAELNFNSHTADFKELPNVENCCPKFESGSGKGYTIGVLYERPFSSLFSLGARLSFSVQDASLRATEFADALDTSNTPMTTTIEHHIDSKLSTVGVEPMLSIRPVGGLYFHLGSRIAFLSSIQYEQAEEILTPGFVFKENLQHIRNQHSGNISPVSPLQYALLVGASMELPLNTLRTVFLSPQMFFQMGLSDLSPNIHWRASALRLGIALKFASAPPELREE